MPRTLKLSYRINGGALTDIATHGFHLENKIIEIKNLYENQTITNP